MIGECNIPIIISGRRTNTDLKFKFVLANPMTGKVKKSAPGPYPPPRSTDNRDYPCIPVCILRKGCHAGPLHISLPSCFPPVICFILL